MLEGSLLFQIFGGMIRRAPAKDEAETQPARVLFVVDAAAVRTGSV